MVLAGVIAASVAAGVSIVAVTPGRSAVRAACVGVPIAVERRGVRVACSGTNWTGCWHVGIAVPNAVEEQHGREASGGQFQAIHFESNLLNF